MRILWLSPWMRTLARVYVEALRDAGHECLLVTSDQHFEPMTALGYERVLDPRPKDPRTLPPLLRTFAQARSWRPDVVVAELVWDPRWLALAKLAPLVHIVHDDQPHDATETRPGWQRRLFTHFSDRAVRIVAFSDHVAGALGPKAGVVGLTSDVRERDVPPNPAERKDFVLYGRLSPYKNVPVALRAWEKHLESGHRGDRLLIIGEGDPGVGELPPYCAWRRGRYTYADVLPVLAAAKGSSVHYRLATQSGVQVLSMQLGVTPIVSDSGGLPEFQPPAERAIGIDDVHGLAGALDALAEPEAAARRGAAARAHYERHFAAETSGAQLAAILADAAR